MQVALGRPVGLYEADYHADRLVSSATSFLSSDTSNGAWPFFEDAAAGAPTSKGRPRASNVRVQGNSVFGLGSMVTATATHRQYVDNCIS